MAAYNQQVLIDELALVAYNGLTDQQATDLLNDTTTGITQNTPLMTSGELYSIIKNPAWLLLTAADQDEIRDLLALCGGSFDPFGRADTMIKNIFGDPSATYTEFKAQRATAISRATELGLPRIKVGYVEQARAI